MRGYWKAAVGVLLVPCIAGAAPKSKGQEKASVKVAAAEPAAPPAAAPAAPAAPAVVEAAPVAPAPPPPAPKPADDTGRPESVEIQVRLLGDKLAAGLGQRPGQGRYERWAVMPFAELGDEVVKRKLGQVVAAALETTLKTDHGFFCVERMRISDVIKEIQLSQTGLMDESKAPDVGKLAGADVMVVGSVGMLGDKYVINVRAVSVEEAKVLAAAQVTVNAAGLVALSSQAVVLRTRSDAVLRSVLIPGWGQLYNRQEQKGGLIMFTSAALVGGGVVFYLLGSSAEREYQSISKEKPGVCANKTGEQFGSCVQGQRQLAQSRYQTSNALLIGLGAVYAYNLLDAFIFGYVPDASTKSLYSLSFEPTSQGVQVSGSF